MKTTTILCLLFITFIGFGQTEEELRSKDAALYRQAIINAMYPEESKVYDDLVEISESNKKLSWKTIDGEKYVRMVSWKYSDSIYRPYLNASAFDTKRWPIWLTAAPQLQERMKKENADDVDYRLLQLLGLPPNAEYNYFIEFWVRPQDMFRPCPDNGITDNKCDVCFPENVTAEYRTWVNDSRISRYYACGLYKQYPWTALGYTYDWNEENTSHVGLSEFVVGANKKIYVAAIYTTEEYLKQKKK